jgi:hypothetical protein
MMASQAAGAEFLERRLARATAVPPAERRPEVAAFVEWMQARELLPLTAAGTPALPMTPATQRQVGGQTAADCRSTRSSLCASGAIGGLSMGSSC